MPELPEIETIRLYLKKQLVGKTLSRIEVLEPKMLIGGENLILDKKVTSVLRSGKILIIQFEGKAYASFHLKLSGQILFAKNSNNAVFKVQIPRANTHTMPGKTTKIILHFTDNSALYFNDMRKFGWMKIARNPELVKGIDILSKEFTFANFENILRKTSRAIKIVLMDQDKIGGIGNIYANDALFEAKIHPARKANEITSHEAKTLYRSILDTIKNGLDYKGSSAHDELYILPNGEKGEYQNHFKAYHKHGTKCPNCGTIMKRIELGGRGTFFCPKCQI